MTPEGLKWKLWAWMIAMPCILAAQYQTKSINLSKTITALETTSSSYLRYGTDDGEVGLYDGILLDRSHRFDGSITNFKIGANEPEDSNPNVFTSEGLWINSTDKYVLASPNNLNVLDANTDKSMLLTTAGIYDRSGNDYIPNREAFYNINEIQTGKFFQLIDTEYLWIDHTIYQKNKSWKEFILHPQSPMSAVSSSERLIIGDARGIVSFDNNGIVDTLLRTDSVGIVKLFAIQQNQILYCADNIVSVFNLRKRTLEYVRDINTELINAATIDRWENIWLSAGSYLYQVIDTKNSTNQEPPEITITKIQVNGSNKPKNESIVLENGANDLEITFAGIHLTYPQDLVYQTKLSASNNLSSGIPNINKWSNASKRLEAEYRNLPAGKYTFQVRATVDENYYTYAKTINIRVNDNSAQYYWLAGLLGAAAVLLTAILFNARYTRLKTKSDQERKQLIQENKMLSLQQKALQLQMNPHFVFNSLNSIQGLIAKEDNKNARRYLQQFSSMMRSVLNHSRVEKITLDDEVAYLKSYISLEQMANNNSFDYTITVEDSVEDGILIPTMIIQPFVENAIIHGVKGLKNRRGGISINIQQKNNSILCTVNDNGQGRRSAGQQKVSSHKSVAIDVVNERLKSKSNHKPIKYTDLIDDEGTPAGTSVSIQMGI